MEMTTATGIEFISWGGPGAVATQLATVSHDGDGWIFGGLNPELTRQEIDEEMQIEPASPLGIVQRLVARPGSYAKWRWIEEDGP